MAESNPKEPNLIWVGRPLSVHINELKVKEESDGRVIALKFDIRVDDALIKLLPQVMKDAIEQDDLDLALSSGKFTQEGGQIGFTLKHGEREIKIETAALKAGLTLKLGTKIEDRMRPDIQISVAIPYTDPAIRYIGAHLCELLTLEAWTALSAQQGMTVDCASCDKKVPIDKAHEHKKPSGEKVSLCDKCYEASGDGQKKQAA